MNRSGELWKEINEGESVGEIDFVQQTISGQFTIRAQRASTIYELPSKDVRRHLSLNSLLEAKFWKCLCQFMALHIRFHLEHSCFGNWCSQERQLSQDRSPSPFCKSLTNYDTDERQLPKQLNLF